MTVEEQAELENISHRYFMLLEEHRQLQRDLESQRRLYASLRAELDHKGDEPASRIWAP